MIKEKKIEINQTEKRADIAICISKLGNEISSIYEISYCIFDINTEKILAQEKIPVTLPLSFSINTKELIDWLEFGSDNFLSKINPISSINLKSAVQKLKLIIDYLKRDFNSIYLWSENIKELTKDLVTLFQKYTVSSNLYDVEEIESLNDLFERNDIDLNSIMTLINNQGESRKNDLQCLIEEKKILGTSYYFGNDKSKAELNKELACIIYQFLNKKEKS